MRTAISREDLKRMFQRYGPARATFHICEALEARQIKPEEMSIQDMFVAAVEGGEELLQRINPGRKSGRSHLMEAPYNAVNTAAFSGITGALLFSAVKEAYNFPGRIGPDLMETKETPFQFGERIPGIGGIGDQVEVVGEGEAFPYVGFNEEYLDLPPSSKRGFIVGLTREMIIADRTGLLLDRASKGGFWLGINEEKRELDLVTGITNNYKRNGTATNTYLTSGAYINKGSVALADHTSLQSAELLFDAITDPNTNEPIMLDRNNLTLVVPSALLRTAEFIVTALQARHGAPDVAPYIQTLTNLEGGLPAGGGPAGIGNKYTIKSSAYVKARSSSATAWWVGDFKRAFKLMQVWGIETMEAPAMSELAFSNDIQMRWKATCRTQPTVWEPRAVVQGNT